MDTQGDAFFVAFARARDAVEAAVDGSAGARRPRLAGRRRVPRPHGPPHRRAVGRGRGLPRDRPAPRRPHRRGRARRPDPRSRAPPPSCVQDDLPAGHQPARPRRAAAEGHRPAGAHLPARRRGPAGGVPAAADGAAEPPRRAAAPLAVLPRAAVGGRSPPRPRRRPRHPAAARATPATAAAVVRRLGRRSSTRRTAASTGQIAGRRFAERASPPATARSGSRTSTPTASRGSTRSKQVVIQTDPGRQRPGRDRLRRRLRLGHERPRRHRLEDRPAARTPSSTRSRSATGPPGVAVGGRDVWVANSSDGTVVADRPRAPARCAADDPGRRGRRRRSPSATARSG